ncbi:DUF84 family protein [Natrarchaeobius oligotrophus]|uniref:Probable inosine/xanthosine triphosphatase n=1 Tax=Natrarchaeobius chitinivorans TaxID=1679083 RepID=A0A3N6PUP4_NATCH|nr:inosine/xanthosine triphosphatase [Natrarchaeobius chitinivorans]RQH03536.1 DUF84 family protein [Natrarchaeobius chitinivorans]
MKFAVGSSNPVKVDAVERALARYDPTVIAVPVDSGVAEQPRSIAETVDGAVTRARRALESVETTCDYGVGLEGGVARYEDVPGRYLIMWAAITDGDRLERASGPSLRLPDEIAVRLEEGAELGPVIDDALGTDGVARGDGAAGVFTDGLTDRTTALSQAVACAFGPFRTPHYDGS